MKGFFYWPASKYCSAAKIKAGDHYYKRKEKNTMKSGVIIYVAGNAPEGWTEEDEVPIKASEPDANLVEIITTKTGHFDIIDAWRDFISRGMQQVTCKMAVFSEFGQIEFTGNRLRLCG